MRNSAIIVGAGPGGAAAAVRLAQRGVTDVVLVDKDLFPRQKTCGSALSPNGMKVLGQLGVGEEVRRLGYRIQSVRVVTPGGRAMEFSTEQAATILLRKHFDNLLVERAKQLGVEFIGGFKASEIEMVFDPNLLPLYGWMFPEAENRVNIGICMDGEEDHNPNARAHAGRRKTTRNVRDVFAQFLSDHYADRLASARQIGKLKGHPISYTTWIGRLTAPGVLYLGEGGRMTHNATGEGIYQAMESGCYAAEAAADVLHGTPEPKAWSRYQWRCRQRFTLGFLVGHALRGALRTPLFDALSIAYNSPSVRRVTTWAVASALAGSSVTAEDRSTVN